MVVTSYLSYDYFPTGFRHILLIRDPHRVIPSVHRAELGKLPQEKQELEQDQDLQKFSVTYPDLHWFGEMYNLWKHLKAKGESDPVIIDTEDLLSNPEPYLKKICETLCVEYRQELLSWDASTDIIKKWKNAVTGDFSKRRASRSKHRRRATESSMFVQDDFPNGTSAETTPDCISIINKCLGLYQEMYKHRFIPEECKHFESIM